MHYAIKILLLCIRYPIRAPSKQTLKIFKNTSAYGTLRTLRKLRWVAEFDPLTLLLRPNDQITGLACDSILAS